MVLGVTGGVGAGKSTILDILKGRYGAFVIEADKVGHEVQKPGENGYKAVVNEFGTEILTADGAIDRAKLAAIVFADQQKLTRLNTLLHPIIYNKIQEKIKEIERTQKHPLIVLEAAILFETGFDRCCDATIYVHADEHVRLKRLLKQRGYSEQKATDIMKNQLKDDEFRMRADFVIENNGNISETENNLGRLLWRFKVGGSFSSPIN